MHQTKKGNQWFFGMKAHIGVDADSGLTHTVITTPANVNDVTQANRLLHGEETEVYGDAGYRGADKRTDANPTVAWQIAIRPGQRRALPHTKLGRLLNALERAKAQMRAKVEHPQEPRPDRHAVRAGQCVSGQATVDARRNGASVVRKAGR